MAEGVDLSSVTPPADESQSEDTLAEFFTEVKTIEKRDSVLTAVTQIDRLTKQGASYFNLNPYEVLQVPPDATADEIKKVYRRFSMIIHPDKNIHNKEKAQIAFEALSKAYK